MGSKSIGKERKTDRRTQYTKEAVKDALLSLLRKKHFNSLSVASVCREADIGRNTFYSHYDSLIDVIDELAEDAIQVTSRPKGNSLKEISELAALLRQKNYSEDKAAQLMLELPVCQRIADNPKYSPLFKDPFIVDYLLLQIYRREKAHMLPLLQEYGLTEEEASALFLFLITGSFAVNREHGWKKDTEWLHLQRVLMTFIDGGYEALKKL